MKVLAVVLILTVQKSHSQSNYPKLERQTQAQAGVKVVEAETIPDCTDSSQQWCNPTNYPDAKVTEILARNQSINQFLDKNSFIRGISITLFDDEYSSYENVCDEKTEYIYPKAAENKAGHFMFIVNNPGGSVKHRQLVKVTKCSRPDQQCGQGELFNSISTSCVQQYSDHKLVALSTTGEELVVDTFTFPSCCVCKVNRSLEL
eukprot:GFUD01087915.1.p1 GENE.GFUD01087915.1~~GFUD01087915.1.p1  ORF type:complete len:204 (-),score=37.86 GFUD01087915.1:1116-1727(-)